MADIRLRADEPVLDPAVTLDSLGEQSNATAVRLETGEDARLLLPSLGRLALIEIDFPAFGDGRGYSAARILREEGYTGELRAVGDFGVDQLFELARCGFDAFAPASKLDAADAENAFSLWDNVYQKTTDGRAPIWQKRHG